MKRLLPLTVLAAATLAVPAFASSDEAWAEFRADVEKACTPLAEVPKDAKLAVEVNPFGSDRFGAALVTVTLADGSADRMVCIYDKTTKAAEMTAPFTPATN